jgi:hypothetical protein
LWNLNVPAKIKIFGWRVLHGLLPCRVILANRHIENSGSCPGCNEGCEDIKHLLFLRKRAQDIWQKIGAWQEFQKYIVVDRSGSVVVAEIIIDGEHWGI